MRSGPGTVYDVVKSYAKGTEIAVVGKNPQGDWLQVKAPDGKRGWMAARLLTVNKNLAGVAVAEIPPTPASTYPKNAVDDTERIALRYVTPVSESWDLVTTYTGEVMFQWVITRGQLSPEQKFELVFYQGRHPENGFSPISATRQTLVRVDLVGTDDIPWVPFEPGEWWWCIFVGHENPSGAWVRDYLAENDGGNPKFIFHRENTSPSPGGGIDE